MATNETRIKHEIGTCPACKAVLTMHLAVELGEHSVITTHGGAAIDVQFEAPKVTGGVLDPHNCIRPKRREQGPQFTREGERGFPQ